MAVTRTGSILEIDSSLNTDSTLITVPADAQLVVVGVGCYFGSANKLTGGAATITLDSVALSIAVSADDVADANSVVIWQLANPSVGADLTFLWDWDLTDTPSEGIRMYVAFYKGVNTAAPIKDEYASNLKSTAQKTTGVLTAASGDMAFAIGNSYVSGTYTFTWGNVATAVTAAAFAGDWYDCAEGTPSGNVTITSDCAQEYNGMAAVIIAASGAAPGFAIPVVMAHYRRRRT